MLGVPINRLSLILRDVRLSSAKSISEIEIDQQNRSEKLISDDDNDPDGRPAGRPAERPAGHPTKLATVR